MPYKGRTVLSIDDDENLRTVVTQYLENDGYKTLTASNSVEALEQCDNKDIEVILLDLVLPDGEGLTLMPQIKAKSNASIIVVSGKSETTEKIICLEMGADDYITKPFEMRELSARIKAVLRRNNTEEKSESPENTPKSKQDKINFLEWCLDRSQYQLFDKNSQSADLTTGEFKLLEALVMSPNRALSREHLFDLTRDGDYDTYDRAIDIQIGRLRKKLNDDPKSPKIIKTIRGVGYMFNGQTDATS